MKRATLALAALVGATIAGAAFAGSLPEPRFGSFSLTTLDKARLDAAQQPFDAEKDCGGAPDDPVKKAPVNILLASADDDAVHYMHGHTLIFHVFINHQGGTWSATERDAAAAKAQVARDFYTSHAPAAANVYFDNDGTGGYYYYETNTRPYTIAESGMSVDIVEDVLASFGVTDDDGDGSRQDEFTLSWQNWNGGWDNVVMVYQPADVTGRARASYGHSRIYQYTDDTGNVWRHEMGHLFGSCDEYEEGGFCNGSGIHCGLCQGWYLSTTADNANCEVAACPGTPVACVMNNNVDAICPSTNTHWGWNDDDANGLLDYNKRQTTLGTYVNILPMFHNGFYNHSTTTSGFVASQRWTSWAAYAIRPPAGSDYDLRLYYDNNHNYQVGSSSQGGSAIDFVVGDYNHNRLGDEHLQASLFSGPGGTYNITWESGTGVLYPDGQSSGTQTWNDYNVVRTYDVPLFAGETITFSMIETSNTLDLGMALFRSTGGTYFAGRSAAVETASSSGVGGNVSFTYTVPADDVYGLVVWADNVADGTFTITIGPAQATLTDDVSFLSALDLRLFNYDPAPGYWSVIGARPLDAATNTDVRLFTDDNFATELGRSDYIGDEVDFIAVDYNHASSAADYLRVSREAGAANHRTEWEQGTEFSAGIDIGSWEANDVAEIYDAQLTGGVTYFLREYHSNLASSFDTGLYLMSSADADYVNERDEFAAFSNSRAASLGGEWLTYTAPATDWYGVTLMTNNEAPATGYSLWLGRKVTFADDIAQTHADEVVFGSWTSPSTNWTVFGARGTGTDGVTLSLYDEPSYGDGFLVSSAQSGTPAYVVGDWNHNTAATVYPRTFRGSGTGSVTHEVENFGEELTFSDASPTTTLWSWTAGDVAEAFDLFLPAGRHVAIQVEDLSGNMDLGIELFKSSGADYYAARGGGLVFRDAAGVGGTEGLVYNTVPLFGADTYGLVVFNKNTSGGTYRITVYNTATADASPAAPAALALSAAPNPFRGQSSVSFTLPAAGDVQLDVFDLQGRLVRTLARGAHGAGAHSVAWDGRDANGGTAGPGLYLARLTAGGETRQLKLVRAN